MEENEYTKAYRNEETNWYFVSRQNFFYELLDKYVRGRKNKILDIGSGAGIILKKLEKYGEAEGVDFSRKAVDFCRLRGLKCKWADAQNLPFKDETFEIVSAFGVIEHVDDDKKALSEIFRVCKKEGTVILECPAYKFLWSPHDEALHHKRRYTVTELKSKMEEAGFHVEKISYIYSFIFLPAVFFRLGRKILGKKSESDPFEKVPSFLNKMLLGIESIERKIVKNASLPFGVSIVCLARKK